MLARIVATLCLLGALVSLGCMDPAQGREEKGSGAQAPEGGKLFLYPERIELKKGGFAEVERGMMFVPLIRSDPDSKVIGVEVYRFRASGDGPSGAPPVFRLYGGPGWSGLSGSLQRKGFYEEDIVPMIQLADLVIVGQRGIGSSKPNTVCQGFQPLPLDREVSLEEQAQAMRRTSIRCRDYWRSKGYGLSGFNVVEAAADVRDVAQALGYQKIVIRGTSFGSHWGMAVMRFHPEIVARAVLSGMEGPDHTYDMPSGVLNALQRIAEAAEKSPQLKDEIPPGGLIEAFKEVISRVEKEPLVVEVNGKKVRFGADDVRSLAQGYTRRTSSRNGIRNWPWDVLKLHSGDFGPAARRRLANNRNRRFPTASFFMLDCGSGISQKREEVLNADPAAQLVGNLGWFYQVACPAWESDLGEEFRQNFSTEIPTVIVHGNWDTSTPYDNALELAPYFKDSKMVTVLGGSHGALGEALRSSSEFREALMKFISTGDRSDLPEEVELPELDWVTP